MRKLKISKYTQMAYSTTSYMGHTTYAWSLISYLPIPKKGMPV